MRSLIFGGTGMLGRAMVVEARRRGWPALALSHAQGDVTSADAVRRWVDSFAPQVVFNCAAFTAVDRCESEQEAALAVNGEAPGLLAAEAARRGAVLVQVSTDYVFAGRGDRPWREEDATAPASVYGRSKLAGERAALAAGEALVVRTSWLFGPGGPDFVATMVRLVEEGRLPLRVVDDQVGCPTYTPFLARALADLVAVGARGVVHYANQGPVSWHELARTIVDQWRPGVEVVPVTTAEFPRPAPRPAWSVLAVDRFEDLVGRPVEPWLAGLVPYLDRLRGASERRPRTSAAAALAGRPGGRP